MSVDTNDRMHLYLCDGMPTLRGCPEETAISVPYVKPGKKKSGWLVTYALLDEGKEDKTTLLTFCPSCAAIVERQMKNVG